MDLTRKSGTPTRRAASGRSSPEWRATTLAATSRWRRGPDAKVLDGVVIPAAEQPSYDRVRKLFENYALDEQDPDVVAYSKAQAREQGHIILF
jgi:hypothetical protein